MLSRTIRSALRVSQANPLSLVGRRAPFSSEEAAGEAKPDEAAKNIPEPTPEEVQAGRDEWGIKYDDECLKFEKEWKQIADKVHEEQMTYLDCELSDLQKKKVDMIADKVVDMNIFEMRYFHASISQRIMRTSGLNPMKVNLDWPSIKQDGAGTWPPANPNWFKQ